MIRGLIFYRVKPLAAVENKLMVAGKERQSGIIHNNASCMSDGKNPLLDLVVIFGLMA